MDHSREQYLCDEIVRVGRLLYEKALIVATDGNISVRLGPDRLLATPSGLHKGFLVPQDLIITDMDGVVIKAPSGARPTSEMPMHLKAYRQRPDISAVLHAHPPTAIALSIAGVDLAAPILPEVILTLGAVPTTEYATPCSDENASAISELIKHHDALVLKRHGALAVGADPFDAFKKLETVEHYARIMFLLKQLDACHPLLPVQVDKLLAIRRTL